jgi:hypothetical protein
LFIYYNLNKLESLFSKYDIIITPHFSTPIPADGVKQNERHFLNSGLYNGGFFAVNKGAESIKFLRWWQERMRALCLVDVAKGLFVDQIWLNYVPIYFKGVHLLDDKGYNVAYWNLHERTLSKKEDQYMVNDTDRLVFYHFSGYNIDRQDILAKYQYRYTFENRPELVPVFNDYRNTLLKNRYLEFSKLNCYYNKSIKNKAIEKKYSKSKLTRLYTRIKRKLSVKLLKRM